MSRRLTADTVAKIKGAAMDGYSVGDVARHHSVSRSTVHAIWTGQYHASIKPAADVGRIETVRVPPAVVRYEGRTLRTLGLTDRQIAARLGVGLSTVRRYLP